MSDDQYNHRVDEEDRVHFNQPAGQLKLNDHSSNPGLNANEPTASTDSLFPSIQGTQDMDQSVARQHLLEAVRHEGYQAESLEDAWGRIIRIQVEIALDPERGSKTTTAARFLAQALGISGSKMEKSLTSPPDIDSQSAKNLLSQIADEKMRREGRP